MPAPIDDINPKYTDNDVFQILAKFSMTAPGSQRTGSGGA